MRKTLYQEFYGILMWWLSYEPTRIALVACATADRWWRW